jgi:hypothetical protein
MNNLTKLKPLIKRPLKPDDEVAPITLVMRKYYARYNEVNRIKKLDYYYRNRENIREKARIKYASNAEQRIREKTDK